MKIVKKEKVVAAGCKNFRDFREITNAGAIVTPPAVKGSEIYSEATNAGEIVSPPVKVPAAYSGAWTVAETAKT
jgi:hypothetical protein